MIASLCAAVFLFSLQVSSFSGSIPLSTRPTLVRTPGVKSFWKTTSSRPQEHPQGLLTAASSQATSSSYSSSQQEQEQSPLFFAKVRTNGKQQQPQLNGKTTPPLTFFASESVVVKSLTETKTKTKTNNKNSKDSTTTTAIAKQQSQPDTKAAPVTVATAARIQTRRVQTRKSKRMIFINALGATTTALIGLGTFALMTYYRNDLAFTLFVGGFCNAVIGKFLKKIIGQSRPAELSSNTELQIKPADNGMPSSHAMSLSFISVFASCIAPWSALPLAVYAVLSLMYRVRVKLHTWQQVTVGSIIGCFNSYLWFRLSVGDNPWKITLNDYWHAWILNEQGLVPVSIVVLQAMLAWFVIGADDRAIIMGYVQKMLGRQPRQKVVYKTK